MIYFKTTDGKHIVIFEPANAAQLQMGRRVLTPDNEVLIVYTHDPEFTEKELQVYFGEGTDKTLKPDDLDRILAEGMKKKVVMR